MQTHRSQHLSPRPLALLLLCAGLSSCVIRVRDGEWETSTWSEWQEEEQQHHHAPAASARSEEGASEAADSDTELTVARLKLEKARLAGAAQVAAAEGDVLAKRAAVEQAEQALARYLELELVTELAAAELRVDREADEVEQARLELEQMVSTYANHGEDDYAKMTAELVVGRTRKKLELAERDLEIARRKLELARDHEQPTKARKLELELEEARLALAGSESELEEARLSSRIDALEAQEALRAAERKTKPKDASEAAKTEPSKTEPSKTEGAGGDE